MSKYKAKQTIKEAAKKAGKALKYGTAIALTSLTLSSANAQETYSEYNKSDKSIMEITRQYVENNPVQLADLKNYKQTKPNSGLTARIATDEAGNLSYSVCYSASSFKEFLNGMAMPFTLWRENKATGKTEILPAYSRPFRSGGILSPEWGLIASGINGVGYLFGRDEKLVYNPFADNPKLTCGMLLDQIVIGAVAAASSGGGKSNDSGTTSTTTSTTSTSSIINDDDNNSNDKDDDGGDTSSGSSGSGSSSSSSGSSSSGSTSHSSSGGL